MSFELERKLIETAYAAGMPVNSAIEFENTKFTAPPAGYTRISVLSGGEGKRIGLTATDQQRHAGIIDVAIFCAPDAGTAGLRATADLVQAALAHKSLSEGFTRIVTFGASLQIIGRAGDWFQANVTIRFERDST